MNTAAQRLLSYWATTGVPFLSGNTSSEIARFESKHRVSLPKDLKEYLLVSDGTDAPGSTGVDREGFAFWKLARFKKDKNAPPTCFLFADYREGSWYYCITVAATSSREAPIYLVAHNVCQLVANSFSEFVDLVIADSPQLYQAKD